MTAMEWLRKQMGVGPAKPMIMTDYGPTTEWVRVQAALNLRNVPGKYEEAIAMLCKRGMTVAEADAKLRRDYPEAFVPTEGETDGVQASD
jgi:hypothetical protein